MFVATLLTRCVAPLIHNSIEQSIHNPTICHLRRHHTSTYPLSNTTIRNISIRGFFRLIFHEASLATQRLLSRTIYDGGAQCGSCVSHFSHIFKSEGHSSTNNRPFCPRRASQGGIRYEPLSGRRSDEIWIMLKRRSINLNGPAHNVQWFMAFVLYK